MPPQLVRADGQLHELILDQTFPLWHDGLSRAQYGHYNHAQMRTAWGTRGLARVALAEGDCVLASAKRYDLAAVFEGRPIRGIGIGAVFTPPDLRGRGYGRAIVSAMVDAAARDGAGLAILFSEIGTSYYEALGFVPVPLATSEVIVTGKSGAVGVPMRTADDRDLPAIAEIHNASVERYRLGLRYDHDWIRYSVQKKRLLSVLGGAPHRDVEFFVAEEGGGPAAWVLLQVERDEATPSAAERWTLESCGDRDPSGARIGALLQSLIARAPAAAAPAIRAWWPPELRPPQLICRAHGASGITMMVRPLGAAGIRLEPPIPARDVLY